MFHPLEKVSFPRWRLIDKVQVSDLCEEYCFHPSLFYGWLKEFVEGGTAAYELEGRNLPQSNRFPAAFDLAPLPARGIILTSIWWVHSIYCAACWLATAAT